MFRVCWSATRSPRCVLRSLAAYRADILTDADLEVLSVAIENNTHVTSENDTHGTSHHPTPEQRHRGNQLLTTKGTRILYAAVHARALPLAEARELASAWAADPALLPAVPWAQSWKRSAGCWSSFIS